ncbi:hypothetical protein J8281_12020 [Aquimarina sp. U1-2]|uniref:hypothetical protein n=1 Tax=Aquimarina sp. U1-2 TaxID=2823141 RepID=UPI001AECF18A|nr:hypothetical protein [Aquimarina sp. U1-2]MBP2832913.1 hypothetical protein [Aquimarina sp. U1-2]
MKKSLLSINTMLLLAVIAYLGYQHVKPQKIHEELKAERLSIVGPDGNLYIAISNPEQQALATTHGVPHFPNSKRDLPGLIFFNRVGDEVGGIYYDGTDDESFAGITFDQQKNDQILAIMKDEYKDGDDWKRWYGMFLRERHDSIKMEDAWKDYKEDSKGLDGKEKQEVYTRWKAKVDATINVYRMFLGREASKNVGLFLYDSKGRQRIKVYVDSLDTPRITVLDSLGKSIHLEQSLSQ